ncbi:MAG: glycosyltransferase [Cellvibrionaceae bacterium]
MANNMHSRQPEFVLPIEYKKAILFVPFWSMAGHVGNNRVDRFVRWLFEDGYEVVIIRAGAIEAVREEDWGREITVVDRLGLHPETAPGQAKVISSRRPNKVRRALAYWLFNPDPVVVWAKAAARHPEVIAAVLGADFILSSSPPESAHVGAWILSQRMNVPHIMDMRDGWLDEPLKPLLLSSALRRWQERRLESRIVEAADSIQVTSDVWKELLDARYPRIAHKVHVLTNGYPKSMPAMKTGEQKRSNKEYVLIHAGRFTSSRNSQKPALLLDPLLRCLPSQDCKGVIQLYGNLTQNEVSLIERYRSRFSEIGWRLEFPGAVPRSNMLAIMQKADGLLLLSASHAALPSKLFEYLATGRLIFYVTGHDSAANRLLDAIPQAINLMNADCYKLDWCNYSMKVPEEYCESFLHTRFKYILQTCFA